MTPATEYPKSHQLVLSLELCFLLIPITIGYILALFFIWDWRVDYNQGEFGLAPEFLVVGLFLSSAWAVTLAAFKGPRALGTLRSLWWWLCGIACLSVLVDWAFLLGFRFGLSWADPSATPIWIGFSLLGSPLLPLAMHCWYLRKRFSV